MKGYAMETYCYLLSYGRSGSTLLDWLMDSHPAVLGVGEIGRLPEAFYNDSLMPRYCGCGVLLLQCPYWGAILREARGLDWKNRPFSDFAGFLLEKLKAMKPEAMVLFDSSGGLLPLMRLMREPIQGITIKVLYLYRDVRGVVYSASIKGYNLGSWRPSVVRTASSWYYRNKQYLNFLRSLPKDQFISVCYDSLTADVDGALRRLQRFLGVEPIGFLPQWKHLPHHTFAGNRRLRLSNNTKIVTDRNWENGLSTVQRLLVNLIAGRLNRYLKEGLINK